MSTSTPVDDQLLEGETDVLSVQHETGVLQEGSVTKAPNGKGIDAIVTLIEEGWGNERDSHYYGADALQESLPLFNTGRSKCYINHLTPKQRQALNGMPRDPREHGARILKESAFMGTGPNGRPAIKARIRIAHPLIAYMVEADPEALGLSIDARGQAEDFVEAGTGRSGRRVKRMTRVVSTDFVTEAGANGEINELLTEGDPLMVEAFVEAQREQGAGMADQSVLDGAADELQEDEQAAPGTKPEEEQWTPVDMEEGELSDDEFDAMLAESDEEDFEEGEEEGWDSLDALEEAEPLVECHVTSHHRGKHHRFKAKDRRHAREIAHRLRHRHGHREVKIHESELIDDGLEEGDGGLTTGHGGGYSRGGRKGAFVDTGELEHGPRGTVRFKGRLKAGVPYNVAEDNEGAGGALAHHHEIAEDPATANHLHDHTRGKHRRRGRDQSRGLGEMVETRAQELAVQMVDEQLDEALAAGLQTQREQFEIQLREAEERHEQELTKVRQGYEVARIVEAARLANGAPLPVGAQRSLKEKHFEHLFEAQVDDQGQIVKPASEVLRETVLTDIREKAGEVEEFREARVTGVGPTAGEVMQEGASKRHSGGRRRKNRSLDQQVDREIGL